MISDSAVPVLIIINESQYNVYLTDNIMMSLTVIQICKSYNDSIPS